MHTSTKPNGIIRIGKKKNPKRKWHKKQKLTTGGIRFALVQQSHRSSKELKLQSSASMFHSHEDDLISMECTPITRIHNGIKGSATSINSSYKAL